MHARAALLHVHSCRSIVKGRRLHVLGRLVCPCSLYMHIRFANNARISGAPKRPAEDIPGSERDAVRKLTFSVTLHIL